jgi:hypothetical protein
MGVIGYQIGGTICKVRPTCDAGGMGQQPQVVLL